MFFFAPSTARLIAWWLAETPRSEFWVTPDDKHTYESQLPFFGRSALRARVRWWFQLDQTRAGPALLISAFEPAGQ